MGRQGAKKERRFLRDQGRPCRVWALSDVTVFVRKGSPRGRFRVSLPPTEVPRVSPLQLLAGLCARPPKEHIPDAPRRPATERREPAPGPLGREVPQESAAGPPDASGEDCAAGPQLSEVGARAPRERRAPPSEPEVGAQHPAAESSREPGRCGHWAAGTRAFSLSCTDPGPPRARWRQWRCAPADRGTAPCRGKAEREATLGPTPCRAALSGPLRPRQKDSLSEGQVRRGRAASSTRETAHTGFHEVSPHLSQARGHGRHRAHSAARAPPASRKDPNVLCSHFSHPR